MNICSARNLLNLLVAWLLCSTFSYGGVQLNPLAFEPNRGQTDREVLYIARAQAAVVLVEDHAITLRRSSASGEDDTVRLELEGANPDSGWRALEPEPGTTSYIVGNDPSRWVIEVAHYGRVVCKNIYPGIDLVLYGVEGRLEYDFVLAEAADPNRIRLRVIGKGDISIASNGDLILPLRHDALVQRKPNLYQTRADGSTRPVQGEYRLFGQNRAGFSVGPYDTKRPLIIDPAIESATLLGGSGEDRVVAADPRTAIIGSTSSLDFPGVVAARHHGTDIFVYLPDRQSTVIIGGSGDDIVTCAKLSADTTSTVLIGGYTNSRDFPVTTESDPLARNFAPQPQYGGGDWDGFLIVLSLAGQNAPLFSTYLGGSGDDRVLAVDFGAMFSGIYLVAGSTTSTDFPLSHAWQTSIGGGTDGWVAMTNGTGQLALSTYLGGSGDDRVLALAAMPSGTDFYVAGETRSSDWQMPGQWTGARSGPSDAFLFHLGTDSQRSAFDASAGLLIGGAGEDRITALAAMPDGSIGIAGATSSPDLAAALGTATPFHGGASDVFIARLSADLRTIVHGSLWGGAGAEEPLSIASNSFNELIAGGWTNSGDFPVTNALDAKCGRGAEDGFLVHLDSTGRAILATCYGGSGSDRITSVLVDNAQQTFFGGTTDSSDIPLKTPVQTVNGGAVDAFFGALTVAAIHADGLTVGKDLSGSGFALLGDSSNYLGTSLTVTTGDPSRVLLAIQPDDLGQTSVRVANGSGNHLGGRTFRVYCLTDTGSVPLTLSAPGYPDRTIQVRCVPSALFIDHTDVSVKDAQGAITIVTVAIDPVTKQVIKPQNPRGGLDPVRIDVTNANPDFLTIRPSVSLDQYSSLTLLSGPLYPIAFSFQTKGKGTADVTFTTSSPFSFIPSSAVHIHTMSSEIRLYVPRVARDLLGQIFLGFAGMPGGIVPITLTSSDPSRVLITANRSQHGQVSVTVNVTGDGLVPAWVEVLDASGSVSITASAPGYDPTTVPISFGEIVAGFYYPGGSHLQQVSVLPGDSAPVSVAVFVHPRDPYAPFPDPTVLLRFGASFQLRFTSSDPAIASPANGIVGLSGPNVLQGSQFTVKALSTGDATLSMTLDSGPVRVLGPLQVHVPAPGISMPHVTVGYNGMVDFRFSLVGKAITGTVPVKLTSADPSRLLLSPDALTPGQPSITVNAGLYPYVYLQALADSGSVEIRAEADGFGNESTAVTLAPSGFAWISPAVTIPVPNASAPNAVTLGLYALDSSNFTPFALQALRPGQDGSVVLQNSNPSAVRLSQDTIPLVSFKYDILSPGFAQNLTITGGGDAQIAIIQPPGFVQPVGRGPLRIKANRPSISFSTAFVGRNLQTSLGYFLPNSAQFQSSPPPMTLMSSDPGRLLLSTDSTVLGSASLTLNAQNGSYPRVLMQALDGPTDVRITASAPGLDNASGVVHIVPSMLAFGAFQALLEDRAVRTNTQQGSLALSIYAVGLREGSQLIGSSFDDSTLRPGLDPISVTIRSSNPTIAAVPKSPILNSATNMLPFQLQALAPGQTLLSIVPPPGFVNAPPGKGRTITVTVDGPAFAIPDLIVGKDLQVRTNLSVQSGAATIPSDVDVTLVSGDPSKVLLSGDAATSGAASLTVHFARGDSPSRMIYVQALDQAGEVPVTITAAGYAATTATVKLTRTTFAVDEILLTGSASSTVLTAHVRPVPSGSQFSYFNGSFQFRPDAPRFSLQVTSSNPAVATVATPTIIFPASATQDQQTITIRPVAPGNTTISFSAPDPYLAPADLPIQIRGGMLFINTNFSTVGKDLENTVSISGDNLGQTGASITVTSADPSRLLVSSSATAPGQASVTIATQPGQAPAVYVQSLSDTGTVTLTASAPGFQDAQTQIRLASPLVILQSPQIGTLTPLSAALTFQAQLASPSDSFSSRPQLRPNASPITVQVTLSDPKIGTLTPSQLTFRPGDTSQTLSFQPTSAGSALLSLSVPAGFGDPLSMRQQLLTVIAARLNLTGNLSVGKDLVQSTTISLPSALGQAVTFTIASSDPSLVLLSNASSGTGAASISVSMASSSSVSGSFFIHGLASAGSVSLQISAPQIGTSSYPVVLEPSGFAFALAPVSVSVNSRTFLTVRSYSLNPQILAPDTNLPLRPGVAPVSVMIVSSDPAVFGTIAPISFTAGDSNGSASVLPTAVGSATLTIQAPTGFSMPSSGATATISVH